MRVRPGLNDPFEEAIDDALSSLPADLRAAMSNVEIVVEDEPPDGQPLLGLHRGVPLPRRSSTYLSYGCKIINIPARLARPQRRPVLHLPTHWPWSKAWLALWHNTIGYSSPLPTTT
jgi:hypothetical protein